MIITKELSEQLRNEDRYIADLKERLEPTGLEMSYEAEHYLRLGIRYRQIFDLAIERHLKGLNPIIGEKVD